MLLTAPSHDFVQKLNLPAHTVNEKKKKKAINAGPWRKC